MQLKRYHYRKKCTSLVDTRLLGTPESLDGGTDWKDWSVVFRSYACACSAPLGLLLERTDGSAGPMLNATLTRSEASCSTQLYFMVVMLCSGTALTRVVNAGAQEGLEAWRCLVLHHELTSLTRSAGLLQELLNFQLRGRDGGSNGTVRPRHRPPRESERRDVPREHPYRRRSSHVARRTVGTTPCPQQCSVDHVGDSEGQDRQCQTRTSCGQLDTTTDGSVSVWHERQVAWHMQRQGKGQGQTQRQCSDDAMPDLWQGWVVGRKTAGTTSPVVGRTRTSPRTRTRAKTARTRPLLTINSSRTKTRRVRCAGICNGTGHYSKDCLKKSRACRLCKVRSNHHPLMRLAFEEEA